MPKKRLPEEALAEKVIAWLEADNWDVYQEVRPWPTYARAIDIVAVKPGTVWAIECKTSLNLEVIAQARNASAVANIASIAVPMAKHSEGRGLAQDILKHYGLGCLMISPKYDLVKVKLEPTVNPKERLRKVLCPEHKTHAKAGTAKGGQWTAFKKTAEAITEYITTHPSGVTAKELENAVKHHYKSPASFIQSISKLALKGVIKGVKLRADARFYPC